MDIDMTQNMFLDNNTSIYTVDMHTGGEPLRIIEKGYPKIEGKTILEKRKWVKDHLDHLRKFLMFEPRGHHDMYGVLLVEPDLDADFGVLFMHNEGYSTMCGHAVIALARYAVDNGMVMAVKDKETLVRIQCPCGVVKAYYNSEGPLKGVTRFHSVPAFAFRTDFEICIGPYGKVKIDIGYGGAFYALISESYLGINILNCSTQEVIKAASTVSAAVRDAVKLEHPDSDDLAFLYGTIITDGKDRYDPDIPTTNICVFADNEVDRCPTGSGVTARIAVQYARGFIKPNEKRLFISGANGSEMMGHVEELTQTGKFSAVIVEVSSKAYYSAKCTFTYEEDDKLGCGFSLR